MREEERRRGAYRTQLTRAFRAQAGSAVAHTSELPSSLLFHIKEEIAEGSYHHLCLYLHSNVQHQEKKQMLNVAAMKITKMMRP